MTGLLGGPFPTGGLVSQPLWQKTPQRQMPLQALRTFHSQTQSPKKPHGFKFSKVSQACLLIFDKVQHLLYCDIKEANAPRNQPGGWLCSSGPPSKRAAPGTVLRSQLCDQVPHSTLQAGLFRQEGHLGA